MSARQRASNTAQTHLQLVKNGAPTAAPAPPTLPKRPCECRCGVWFTPARPAQKYVDDDHRYARFINDKRDATFEAVWYLAYLHSGMSTRAADKVAHTCVEHYFTRTCKALEQRGGWKYDTKAKAWRTWAMRQGSKGQ